jgi:hypothetical protein
MPTTNAEELWEKLTKGKELTIAEQVMFAHEISFKEFIDWVSKNYGVECKGPQDYSRVISTFYKRVENGFERLGIDTSKSESFNIKNGATEKEVEETNVETKVAFNANLDECISQSSRYVQITNDYDLLGEANTVSENKRPAYRQAGKDRIKAFEKLIAKGGEADVLMRVIEKDGRPHGVRSAKKLVEANIRVYNYDEGEKFGAGTAWELSKEEWMKYVNKVFENAEDLKELSDGTGLPQAALKRFKDGEEPTYKEMLIIIKKYETLHPEDKSKPYKEKHWAFFVCRDFYKDEKPQAEEPQMHKKFNGVIVYWEAAAKWIMDYADSKKTDPKTEQMTKKTLEKY